MSLKFRRNYLIILLFVGTLLFLAFVMGDVRIIAYTVEAEGQQSGQAATSRFDVTNQIDLFDDSVVHSIEVVMSEEDYDTMIATYQETGFKEYFRADVIVDGVEINQVGIRLKGNASLQTVLGGGRMGGRNMPGMGEQPQPPAMGDRPVKPEDGGGFQPPVDGERPEPPAGAQIPGPGQGPGQDGSLQFNGEGKLPFMIKFDEFVDGQTYQGYTAIAIRTYGISWNAAILQEPVTNQAARLAGLPATQTAYTGFKINNAEETLYVVSELVNQEYISQYFENDSGVLYKAELGSTLSYLGDDPSSYANSFTQQTRVNDADLAPLIDFMRFLDQADDDSFEKALPDYLDVDAFATYLAINALLVNTDSMIGMNNNYYLYYDDVEGRFTLLMWDTNESLGKLAGNADFDLDLSKDQEGRAGPGGRAGMGGGQNRLLERFLANETFKALYEQKLMMVYKQVFVSGALSEMVERYSTLMHEVNEERNLVEVEAYDQAVEQLRSFIEQRMSYLASTELLGGYREEN